MIAGVTAVLKETRQVWGATPLSDKLAKPKTI
jgi:hypothetical protein